jgi:hypothetical protein
METSAKAGELLFAGDRLRTRDTAAAFIFCPHKQSETLAPASDALLTASDIQVSAGRILSRAPLASCLVPQMVRVTAASLQHFGATIVRGESELMAAVVKLTGRRVDLAPAFVPLDPGDYQVDFLPPEGGAVSGKINYDAGSQTSLSVPGLTPGFYTVKVLSADGVLAGTAPVLVTRGEEFDAKNAEFQNAKAFTLTWPKDTDHSAAQLFLGAVLMDMAGR